MYFLYSEHYEAGEMFSSISSMSSSMTTSLQLAKDCLESARVETNIYFLCSGYYETGEMFSSKKTSISSMRISSMTTSLQLA